jgi:hypothetical protein
LLFRGHRLDNLNDGSNIRSIFLEKVHTALNIEAREGPSTKLLVD